MTEEYYKYGFYIKNQSSMKNKYVYIFLVYVKMSEISNLSCYQKNKDLILNKAKYFYKDNKERQREQARDKYRSLSEEEKNKKKRMQEEQVS